jgi:two-component system NtrC family response regulator
VRQNAETHAIRQALVRAGGNISRTAELLGVTRPTLYDLMAKYGIRAEEGEAPVAVAPSAGQVAAPRK